MALALRPSDVFASAVQQVRLHAVERRVVDGQARWFKRRRRGIDGVIVLGGLFLRATRSGLNMFPSAKTWQSWEVESFRLLHRGEGYDAGPSGPRGLWMDDLPGLSLRHFAEANAL